MTILLYILLALLPASPDSEMVSQVYQTQSVPYGTLAKTGSSDFEEVDELLVATKYQAGRYSVTLYREGDHLYRISGSQLYLKMPYCYEYSYGDDAVFSSNGYGGGTVTFIED